MNLFYSALFHIIDHVFFTNINKISEDVLQRNVLLLLLDAFLGLVTPNPCTSVLIPQRRWTGLGGLCQGLRCYVFDHQLWILFIYLYYPVQVLYK